jgi:cytochrome P450
MASVAEVPGTSGKRVIPDHVPAELVFEPKYEEPNTLFDPFIVTKDIYEELPPIFYWPRPSPGRYDGTWVVTHYDDIAKVYQDDSIFSAQDASNFQGTVGETFKVLPQSVDAPVHGPYRKFLNPWFTPKVINAQDDQIGRVINGLIDTFIEKGECDVSHDFCRPFPVLVFLNLMGFPEERVEDFLAWEYAILADRRDIDSVRWGSRHAIDYLRGFIEEVRAKPNDKLASAIIHGKIGGRSLNDDEIIGMLFMLFLAGLDTVSGTTAFIFRRLALDVELQQKLRENPELISGAVDEFMRIFPIVNASRMAIKDYEIRGVKIKAGDFVMCYAMAGNFDPDEFKNPRETVLARQPNRHFSFGSGAHLCLGQHLAKREMRMGIAEFLRRIPPFTIKPGADLTAYPGQIAARHVPVVWDTKAIVK